MGRQPGLELGEWADSQDRELGEWADSQDREPEHDRTIHTYITLSIPLSIPLSISSVYPSLYLSFPLFLYLLTTGRQCWMARPDLMRSCKYRASERNINFLTAYICTSIW
jgi:hypothetical protein